MTRPHLESIHRENYAHDITRCGSGFLGLAEHSMDRPCRDASWKCVRSVRIDGGPTTKRLRTSMQAVRRCSQVTDLVQCSPEVASKEEPEAGNRLSDAQGDADRTPLIARADGNGWVNWRELLANHRYC